MISPPYFLLLHIVVCEVLFKGMLCEGWKSLVCEHRESKADLLVLVVPVRLCFPVLPPMNKFAFARKSYALLYDAAELYMFMLLLLSDLRICYWLLPFFFRGLEEAFCEREEATCIRADLCEEGGLFIWLFIEFV